MVGCSSVTFQFPACLAPPPLSLTVTHAVLSNTKKKQQEACAHAIMESRGRLHLRKYADQHAGERYLHLAAASRRDPASLG